jgi:malate synthase
MSQPTVDGIDVTGDWLSECDTVLSADALAFLRELHRKFQAGRAQCLTLQHERQSLIDRGQRPGFREETRAIREGDWTVAPILKDLEDRRVEITGPCERKMIINALNSGAKVFMADFEDSLSPTWSNVIVGQSDLMGAVRRSIQLETDDKAYRLGSNLATLVVRPRGWHLDEAHVRVDGDPLSASLFDFGLYFFHNAHETLHRGTAPYFYLPKLESHEEARLWNSIFNFSQDFLHIPRGTIKATVLIETILAVLEMDEIIYELRDHMAGLNAGRWDYLFSTIKKFHSEKDFMFPDRAQLTMTVPFMRAYTELLVRSCHRRGTHAIGGMAAFIPSRKDPEVNRVALAQVREDKQREAAAGFDGTWVAHPDLVPVAMEQFDAVLGKSPNQKHRLREDVSITAPQLLDFAVPQGRITEHGFRNNISVALQYIAAWLLGSGAVAIFDLMEDAATTEISRAELWIWLQRCVTLDTGKKVTRPYYEKIRDEEIAKLSSIQTDALKEAAELLDSLVLSGEFIDFLTLSAYQRLIARAP